jgi:N-acetylglucosaminyl-diphospho-decaprenol L-rhamnosyltransferase
MALDLTVVITTYNSAAVIGASLASLLALPPDEAPAGITVVDNASSDDSAAIAESFPGVAVIRYGRNAGLARANNLGAAGAGPGSILFLNPDTVILPGAFAALATFEEEHPDAAILGPATIDARGAIQSTARTFPSLLDIALRRSFLGRIPTSRSKIARHLHPVDGTAPARVDWLVGAALWLTRRGREKVGLMSEDYFLYFEDVDWCWRARESGMEVWLVPDAVIRHECARESASRPGRALWHHLRSMVRFFSRHPSALF